MPWQRVTRNKTWDIKWLHTGYWDPSCKTNASTQEPMAKLETNVLC